MFIKNMLCVCTESVRNVKRKRQPGAACRHGKVVPVAAMIMTRDEGNRAEFCSSCPKSQECLEPGCGQWKIRHRDLRLGLLEPRQKPEKNEDLCHSPGFFGLKTCGSLGNNMDLNTQPYGSELDSNWTELALLEMNTSVGIRETDAWCPEKSSVSPRTGNSWSWSSAHAGQGFGLVFQNEEEYSSRSPWGLPGVTREFLYPLRFW